MSILPTFLHLFFQYHEHYTCISRAKGCWMMFCHASYSLPEVFPNMLIIVRKCQLINVLQPKQMLRTSISLGNGKPIFKFSYYLIEPKLSRPAPDWMLFCEGWRFLLLGMFCSVWSCYLSALAQASADPNHWPILKLLDSLSFSLILLSLTLWGGGRRERYYCEIFWLYLEVEGEKNV